MKAFELPPVVRDSAADVFYGEPRDVETGYEAQQHAPPPMAVASCFGIRVYARVSGLEFRVV